jgi:hypothetical protein
MNQPDDFPPALPHGHIKPVFDNVFTVTGAMETVLMGMDWAFSRNMIIVREGDRLILINTVRLDEAGLAELDDLGKVTDVVRLGALHGRDDEFYRHRYDAKYWTLPGLGNGDAQYLSTEGEGPIADAEVFLFESTQIPEAILRLNRDGGILIACDALQNWVAPDEHFCDASRERMEGMGFFTPANVGPVWMQAAEPSKADFKRLSALEFKHALCGHGEPVHDSAATAYKETFERLFG